MLTGSSSNIITAEPIVDEAADIQSSLDDYSEILKSYRLEFKPSEYYWQVGEIKKVQGWILHLSVISSQLEELLRLVIPELILTGLPFKIIQNIRVANSLLGNFLGYINLGKMVSIYPGSDLEAINLAKMLIDLTKPFRGPAIPTDLHLGSVVYTRYGSFNPPTKVNTAGASIKFIYDNNEQLIPDPYTIPFSLPKGVNWPYTDIVSPIAPRPERILKHSYYPLQTLKTDAKGDVFKALYFKKFWQIKSCLIKQGRMNMATDKAGRDIRDRLQWQYDLYQDLAKEIPLPKTFDYFIENNDGYLAMEFIKAIPFTKWLDRIYSQRSWRDLPASAKIQLLDKFLAILDIIRRLHAKGYIHRDITTENFLIGGRQKIFVIDLELTWFYNTKNPARPFVLGTPGFMSPEQKKESQIPTIKEDIYGLGATMVAFFTNLQPIKLSTYSGANLKSCIVGLTQNEILAQLISDCLHENPDNRPSILTIKNKLNEVREELLKSGTSRHSAKNLELIPTLENVGEIISIGISGLVSTMYLTSKGYWKSKKITKAIRSGETHSDLVCYEGWYIGVSGPIWLLAKAKSAGHSIAGCIPAIDNNLLFIKDRFNKENIDKPAGLYMGSAGIAMTFVECIYSGLLPLYYPVLELIEQCFPDYIVANDFSLSSGMAGIGLSLLNCSVCVDSERLKKLLNAYLLLLANSQQKDGSWEILAETKKKKDILIGLSHGVAGIVWFLLCYLEIYPDIHIKEIAIKALNWLIKKAEKKGTVWLWSKSTKIRQKSVWNFSEGGPGIALVFIKAYKAFKDPLYKEIAEGTLQIIPERPIIPNFTLDNGLAGLGEIYLEAHRAFNDPKWLERAEWITQILIYTFHGRENSSGYWMVDETDANTADLFFGNSGIVHFLIRFASPDKLNHPLSLRSKI